MGIFLTIGLTISSFYFTDNIHKASWYGGIFHGRLTANGEVYDKWKLTCAATNEYKLGEYLKVTNVDNNQSVVVKVNDRGNFEKYNRTLDLSRAAFDKIADLDTGVIDVQIERIN